MSGAKLRCFVLPSSLGEGDAVEERRRGDAARSAASAEGALEIHGQGSGKTTTKSKNGGESGVER